MSNPPQYWNKSKKFLSKRDKVMRQLIKKYSDKTLTTRKDIFFSICKSIVGQQISVAAASSIFLKFKKICRGKITPKVVKNLGTFSFFKYVFIEPAEPEPPPALFICNVMFVSVDGAWGEQLVC